MLLAQSGCDVTVFERQDRVGGRTAIIGDDRFRFDLGPTFFLYPRVLEEIFAACGYDLRREVELIRLDPQYHLVFEAGGDIRATPDAGRMAEQIARLDPHDAAAFVPYMADNRAKLAAFRPILESHFGSPLQLLRPSVLGALRRLRPHKSVNCDLGRFFRDPRVRLAFSFQSKYLGMSPFQCPSLFTILSFLEYEYGVYHPVGGCGAVMRKMADLARKMGVKIRLDEGVERLEFSGRRVDAIVTEQGRYPTDAIVFNADFAAAMRRLVPNHLRRRWSDRKIETKKFSCSTFMMYLGLEGSCEELEHHTIWLAKDYQKNLHDIEISHQLSDNPSFYVQNATRTDPSLAPRGFSTLYCLAPVTHQSPNVDWSRQTPRFRSLLLEQLKKIGLKDVEKRIRFERVVTPADWQNQFHVHKGATFNLAHSLDQMLHRRPHNRFDELANAYLVGGGTHPGSGLPVIFESARISSRLVLEDLAVPFFWPAQTGQAARYAQKHWPSSPSHDALVGDYPVESPGHLAT